MILLCSDIRLLRVILLAVVFTVGEWYVLLWQYVEAENIHTIFTHISGNNKPAAAMLPLNYNILYNRKKKICHTIKYLK